MEEIKTMGCRTTPNVDYRLIAANRGFSIGCLMAHFKRETVDTTAEPMKYLYLYLGLARHTETGETMVVYKPAYETECVENVNYVVRPAAMFFSEVDHEKYPDIKEQYRFYPVHN